jgi:hypothetical protein
MGLGTSEIKQLIGGWLSDSNFKSVLLGTYLRGEKQKDVDQTAGYFGLQPGAAIDQLSQHIFDLWKNPEEWKRAEKRRIKSDWVDYIESSSGTSFEFVMDFAGWQDQKLVNDCGNNPNYAETCWYRLFEPKSALGSSFRLEIITTPDDEAVVGWVIFVD